MITFLDSINTTYNTGLLINLWMITSWRYANSNEDSNSKPICDKIIITSFTDAHISFLAAWCDNLQQSPHISSSGSYYALYWKYGPLYCTIIKQAWTTWELHSNEHYTLYHRKEETNLTMFFIFIYPLVTIFCDNFVFTKGSIDKTIDEWCSQILSSWINLTTTRTKWWTCWNQNGKIRNWKISLTCN